MYLFNCRYVFLYDIKMFQHGTIFSLNNIMFIYMVWTWEINLLIQLLKYIWFYNVYNCKYLHLNHLYILKYKWHISSKRWSCLRDKIRIHDWLIILLRKYGDEEKKDKVFYGQEPPSGESTTSECGFNYQLLAVIYWSSPMGSS